MFSFGSFHHIPNKVREFDGPTSYHADRKEDSGSSGTKRSGKLCIDINDAWGSNVFKVDEQCFPDVELQLICSPYCLL